MRRAVRRASLLTSITLAALALIASGALAAGAAVKIGTGTSSTPPSVAVDSAGTAYIVWTTSAENVINYCRLPTGASACATSSTIPLSGGGAVITGGNPMILFDGTTLVVLADVTTEASGDGDGGVQEWTSASPYTTFTPALGGEAVNFVGENAGTIGAVELPGGAPNDLGVAWEIPGGAPQFEVTGATPAQQSAAGPEPTHASLDPANSLKASNGGGVVASQLASNPGVLEVVNTLENTPCNTFGLAYAYAPGAPSPGSYNLSANVAGSAWQSAPLSQLDCQASHPAVGGGPKGFGVLEQDESVTPNTTAYRPFDEANGKFDLPAVPIAHEGELFPSLGQDTSGNIYATWLGSGGIRLATSSNGGSGWSTPVTLDTDPAVNDLSSSIGAGGQGWASWVDASGPNSGPLYALPFVAASTGGANTTQTVSVGGDNVSLSAPSQCVRNGIINSEIKVSLPSAKRKGSVVVKIYQVTFKVDGQTVTIKRNHLSNAPFKVTIHLAHVKPGTRIVLTAHALIAVKHGPKRSKTLRITLTSCA